MNLRYNVQATNNPPFEIQRPNLVVLGTPLTEGMVCLSQGYRTVEIRREIGTVSIRTHDNAVPLFSPP